VQRQADSVPTATHGRSPEPSQTAIAASSKRMRIDFIVYDSYEQWPVLVLRWPVVDTQIDDTKTSGPTNLLWHFRPPLLSALTRLATR